MNTNEHIVADKQPCSLVRADRATLVDNWAWIRNGLLTIKASDPHSGEWIPEHVRQRIEIGLAGNGYCHLLIVYTPEGKRAGFTVVTASPDIYINAPLSFYVWIAYMENGHWSAWPGILKDLEAIARADGFRYVDGMSSREGWMARLMRSGGGYEAYSTLYRKKLYAEDDKR